MHNCTAGFEIAIANNWIYENITCVSVFASFMMINWSLSCWAVIRELSCPFAVSASACHSQALLLLFHPFLIFCDVHIMTSRCHKCSLKPGCSSRHWDHIIVIKLVSLHILHVIWMFSHMIWAQHKDWLLLVGAVRCVNNSSKWDGSHCVSLPASVVCVVVI